MALTIQQFFARHHSPVAPYSKMIYRYSRKKGVNPRQVAAHIMAETEGGLTGTGRPGQYNLTGIGGVGHMRSYSGYPAGIRATIDNLATPRYKGKPLRNQAAMWVAGTAPNATTDKYFHTIASYMKQIGGGGFPAGSPAQAARGSRQQVQRQQQQTGGGIQNLGYLSNLIGSISGVPALGSAMKLLGAGNAPMVKRGKVKTGVFNQAGAHNVSGTPESILRLLHAARTSDRKSPGYSKLTARGPLKNVSFASALDCSLSVAKVLQVAGLGYGPNDTAPVSGTMAQSWGKPGKGKYLTMYANGEHVFLEFKIKGKFYRFDTSAHSDPDQRSGPRIRRTQRSTAGFTARHWPGL